MDYGRLGSSTHSVSGNPQPSRDESKSKQRRRRFFWAGLLAAAFLLFAGGVSVTVLVMRGGNRSGSLPSRAPTQAMSQACGLTRFPALCLSSLLDYPGSFEAGVRDLVHISINMTRGRVGDAMYGASAITGTGMGKLARAAFRDCMELLGDSLEQLSDSLLVVLPPSSSALQSTEARVRGASDEDVLTWLSGAATNHDTCQEGLQQVEDPYVRGFMEDQLKDLSELLSNSLAMFSGVSRNKDFTGIPIQNKKKRRLLAAPVGDGGGDKEFPDWIGKKDRRLLQIPAANIQADMVVSKDGNGTYRTITEAVKAAPENSGRRIIIYIRAGRYTENIKIARKKTNLMLIGDGKTQTIIAGSRSVADKFTTFHTATLAATGTGFIMRDITVENTAGPEKHQAVALRVGADRAAVYRCDIRGYQDTLYVHSQRQFYRECGVYGTVDFIFGNAAAVLQRCTLSARKPLPQQKNTITAQGRKDPNQNTGISIHFCRLTAEPELEAAKADYPTYLGRPWRQYARVVYMQSSMGDHIHPAGWLEWDGAFALGTLYYGEYMNSGPGAGVAMRVNWPGFRVITLPSEASKFTVAKFIYGFSWLPMTGVAFSAGLDAL
ncbi:pectinesterase-like [Zingiber officinale]|uniref:Pectinesterase n=1 Tax=Zingiber officinale TaxID=94328 RepID=A0A8J5EZ07_ZINOF|nr:pectinesterase-like [Zingiber officinale]KAG6477520.1 hypothetical protein ZIOFF_066787 [Zingiber officinale]